MNSTLPALLGESKSFAFAICEVIFDAQQQPIKAICCELNPLFAELIGKPLTGILGQDFYLENFALIAQLRGDVSPQIYYQKNEQQYKVDVIYQEASHEILIIFTNITAEIQLYSLQYKAYKDRADESDEHYTRLVNSSTDPILLFGNGVFIEANEAAAHLLGYKNKSDLLLLTPMQLAPERQPNGELTSAFSVRMNAIALQKGYNRFECIHTKADGSDILIEVSLTTIHYQGDTIFYCAWRDLTEEKCKEQELKEQQERMLLDISTPITQLWKEILLLPLVGRINSKRAQNILSAALQKIAATQTKVFILDIAGVDLVDTAVANSFIRLAKATRLMGCQCIISGISPQVAQTIVELGIQADELNTTGDLQTALQKALLLTGKQIAA